MRALVCSLLVSLAGCAASTTPPPATPDRAAHIESSLLPVVHVEGTPLPRYRLAERMAHYHVPGVTVAVADGGAIVWARGYGVVRAGESDAVTAATLFQAGSVSKPVAATATLRLVDQGKLSLDEDVNVYLRSWKVPENELTAKEKVTLRRILSHSAGTTVHGFPGYAPGVALPTLQQILDGQAPANTRPVRVELVPGQRSRYSGGGVTIEQLLLTETTGKAFPVLLDELVLGPLGMKDSTYEEPLPPPRAKLAASAHDGAGKMVPGGCHVYPEMAAAGLWTTPTDLLRWSIAIAGARDGRAGAILSQKTATDMLTVQKEPFGLGPVVGGAGRAFHFRHDGEDEGFLTLLRYYPGTGQGAVVMLNGAGGRALLTEILEAIAVEYGWPEVSPRTVAMVPVDSPTLDAVVGTFEANIEVYRVTVTVRREGTKLFLAAPVLGIDSEVVFTSPKMLTLLDGGEELEVVSSSPGQVSALRYGDFEIPRK